MSRRMDGSGQKSLSHKNRGGAAIPGSEEPAVSLDSFSGAVGRNGLNHKGAGR